MHLPKIINFNYAEYVKNRESEKGSQTRAKIYSNCLDGNIIILKGANLHSNLNCFYMRNDFPQDCCKLGIYPTEALTKITNSKLDFLIVHAGKGDLESKALGDQELQKICEECFDGDWSRFKRFSEGCRTVEFRLRDIAQELLQDVNYYADAVVWRFAKPESMHLHYDTAPNVERKESLRFFVNLDSKPRRWECSQSLRGMIEKEYKNLKLSDYFDRSTQDRMARLSKKIGKSSALANAPKAEVRFDPGDIWVFDGRAISHTVTEGNRALSITTKIEKRSLPENYKGLSERLFAVHMEQQALAFPNGRL